MNVKELLRKLVAIQKIDEELFSFRREIRERPAELEPLKTRLDRVRARVAKREGEVRDLEMTRRSRELDLKTKEQDILRADASLMSLKTNKEYQARLFEIEQMKADKSILEEQILKLMDELERGQKALEEEKAVLAGEEQQFLAEKEKVDAVVLKLKEDSAGLEARRLEAMQGVDREPLAVYDRIIDHRDGRGIVPVVNNACGGCFMHLPPQTVNKIKMYDELVRCEVCTRFMYLQEEIG